MNSNLVIIGTRNRPGNVSRAFEQLKKVSVASDFLMIINEDQQDLYPDIEGVMREVAPSEFGALGKANHVLHKYWDSYQTITGIDDDCMVTTRGWDLYLASPIVARGYGVCYGNDMMQGENLPTKVMISANIVKALGFFAPPVLFHLYADNFWKALGEGLEALNYFPDVMMEHWHYFNGKAELDENYTSIYDPLAVEKDLNAFNLYMSMQFATDMERVHHALGLGV